MSDQQLLCITFFYLCTFAIVHVVISSVLVPKCISALGNKDHFHVHCRADKLVVPWIVVLSFLETSVAIINMYGLWSSRTYFDFKYVKSRQTIIKIGKILLLLTLFTIHLVLVPMSRLIREQLMFQMFRRNIWKMD